MNGHVNGGTAEGIFGVNEFTHRLETSTSASSEHSDFNSNFWAYFTRTIMIIDNLMSPEITTKNSADKIDKVTEETNEDGETYPVYHLGQQFNFGFPSLYAETWGMDRKKSESLLDFIGRLLGTNLFRESNCVANGNNCPYNMAKIN